MQGIEVGDLGKKLGYNAVDNGYLMLDQVRVCRKALLSRFTEITPEGDFEIKADPRILYSIMSKIRLQLVYWSAYTMYRASMTAVRYSVCRRQFPSQ